MKKVLLASAILAYSIGTLNALDGRYIGVALTTDNVHVSDANIESEAALSGILQFGYNFSRYFAVELETATGLLSTTNTPQFDEDENTESYAELDYRIGANARIGIPVTEYLSLVGKAGYNYSKYSALVEELDEDTDEVNYLPSKYTGWSPNYSVGIGYDFIAGDRVEVLYTDYMNSNKVKYRSITFGYQWSF